MQLKLKNGVIIHTPKIKVIGLRIYWHFEVGRFCDIDQVKAIEDEEMPSLEGNQTNSQYVPHQSIGHTAL